MDWTTYNNFFKSEFDHGGPEMEKAFMDKLQRARTMAEFICMLLGFSKALAAFIITSGSRSKERNRQVGGKDDSTHLIGRAADIEASTSRTRIIIVVALLLAGFTRIGLSKEGNFIHVDDGENASGKYKKEPWVMWLY